MRPWTKDYHTSVSKMPLPVFLRSTLTDDTVRPPAHYRQTEQLRCCNAQECGDEVCAEVFNDGKDHVSQGGVPGSSRGLDPLKEEKQARSGACRSSRESGDHTHTNFHLEQRLDLYEVVLLPWDIETTVEESLSDDEDGIPTASLTPSRSLNPKRTLTKFCVICRDTEGIRFYIFIFLVHICAT